MVTFKVNSSSSTDTLNITRIAATNTRGQATVSFRIPISNQKGTTTWHAYAIIQTTDDPIQKEITFTTYYNMEITSLFLLDSQGHKQTTFQPGDTVTVELSINNKGQAQTANITLNLLDSTDVTLNESRVQNEQIAQNSSQLQATIQIPHDATAGAATIEVGIFSGTYEGVDIPVAEGKTASFTIGSGGAEPTSTPTATPSETPTPTPGPYEMSISLFSWLLIATGFFTFKSLAVFLRRRQTTKLGTPIPGLPPGIATSAVSTNINQNPPPTDGPTFNMPNLPSAASSGIQEQGAKTILTHLSKVNSSVKRIEELRVALKAEKDQLTNELTDLNKTVEEQERTVKNYFEALRREIQKSQATLTGNQQTTKQKNTDQPNN